MFFSDMNRQDDIDSKLLHPVVNKSCCFPRGRSDKRSSAYVSVHVYLYINVYYITHLNNCYHNK